MRSVNSSDAIQDGLIFSASLSIKILLRLASSRLNYRKQGYCFANFMQSSISRNEFQRQNMVSLPSREID